MAAFLLTACLLIKRPKTLQRPNSFLSARRNTTHLTVNKTACATVNTAWNQRKIIPLPRVVPRPLDIPPGLQAPLRESQILHALQDNVSGFNIVGKLAQCGCGFRIVQSKSVLSRSVGTFGCVNDPDSA